MKTDPAVVNGVNWRMSKMYEIKSCRFEWAIVVCMSKSEYCYIIKVVNKDWFEFDTKTEYDTAALKLEKFIDKKDWSDECISYSQLSVYISYGFPITACICLDIRRNLWLRHGTGTSQPGPISINDLSISDSSILLQVINKVTGEISARISSSGIITQYLQGSAAAADTSGHCTHRAW